MNIEKVYKRSFDNPLKEDGTPKENELLGEFEIIEILNEDSYTSQKIGVLVATQIVYLISEYEVSGRISNDGGSRFEIKEIKKLQKYRTKPTQKLDNIYEFMVTMGFEPTEKMGIYKHRYFVNEHYIEFDLSACALEKWAVMQHIFEASVAMGSKFKQIEICNVLGVAQHSI